MSFNFNKVYSSPIIYFSLGSKQFRLRSVSIEILCANAKLDTVIDAPNQTAKQKVETPWQEKNMFQK